MVRDINFDDIALLQQTKGTACRRFGADMTDGCATACAAETPVCNQCNAFIQLHPCQSTRRVQHFTHTGATLGAFISDDNNISGMDAACVDGCDGILFAVKHTRRACMAQHFGVYCAQNIQRYQTAVWSAIDEAHDALLREIESIAEDDEGITIIDEFHYSSVNATLILCQYSAAKGTDKINTKEIRGLIKAHRDALFSYQKTSGHTYRIYYIGDAYFADYVFKLTEQQKKLAELYAANLELFLYGSQFGSVSAQVSEDVLKYGTLVKKCAEKYGISNFTDVINAVMMAESGGRGTDVMQASECPYNQKYPKKPNGIKNTEYSIEVGVHYLADCLKGAGCTAPNQTEKLSLALQGYNYGNGYISWAIQKYGGYTEANAQEFSKIMQKKLGWSRYGNPKYVSAVFRYLLFSGNGKWGSPFVGRNWNSVVSSEFGWRTDPLNGKKAFHEGLDIAYPSGTKIHAVSGGVVTSVVYSKKGYGHHVRVDCGNGVTVLYAHCSKILVTKGQSISTGQAIAEVGATGRVTGAHLHLGVLVNGKEVNPREYIGG